MERDYGKKNGEKHAGEKKGEGEYLSPTVEAECWSRVSALANLNQGQAFKLEDPDDKSSTRIRTTVEEQEAIVKTKILSNI